MPCYQLHYHSALGNKPWVHIGVLLQVCFVYRFVVDDGDTVVTGGLRTQQSLAGKGLMNYLQSYADHHLQKHLPKPASRLVYTAFYTETLQHSIDVPNQAHNTKKAIIMKRVGSTLYVEC